VARLFPFLSDFILKSRYTRWIRGGYVTDMAKLACRIVSNVREKVVFVTLHVGGNDVCVADPDSVIREYAVLTRHIREQSVVAGKRCLISICSLPPRIYKGLSIADRQSMSKKLIM